MSGDPDAVWAVALAITAGASTVRPSYGPHQPVYLRSAWEVAAEIADYQDSGLEASG